MVEWRCHYPQQRKWLVHFLLTIPKNSSGEFKLLSAKIIENRQNKRTANGSILFLVSALRTISNSGTVFDLESENSAKEESGMCLNNTGFTHEAEPSSCDNYLWISHTPITLSTVRPVVLGRCYITVSLLDSLRWVGNVTGYSLCHESTYYNQVEQCGSFVPFSSPLHGRR